MAPAAVGALVVDDVVNEDEEEFVQLTAKPAQTSSSTWWSPLAFCAACGHVRGGGSLTPETGLVLRPRPLTHIHV